MVGAIGWRNLDLIGAFPEFNIEIRAEHLAAAAVMAGCKPSYSPVLRALSTCLVDPRANISGAEVTTGGAAILVIVGGPAVEHYGFGHEANSLGANNRVNATIGRFANMVRHFCGSGGGALHRHGTIGHPGRITYCVAEHPKTVWPPFHTQLGFASGASVVSIVSAEGPNSVNNHYGDNGAILLETIADCVGQFGSTNYYWRIGGGYIVVIPPDHMDLIGRDFTREQARAYLYSHAQQSTDELRRLGRIPREPVAATRVQPGTMRSPVDREEQLMFIESGAAGGRFSAVIPLWVGCLNIVSTIISDDCKEGSAVRIS
jgi:hypothetical protein